MKRILPFKQLKKAIGACAILALSSQVYGQQDPYFTHYTFVRQLYNPAVVGIDGRWCAFGIGHMQYIGLEDRTPEYTTPTQTLQGPPQRGVGPKTNGAGIAIPLSKYNKATQSPDNFGGIGLTIYDDQLGYEQNLNIRGQFAYRKYFQPGVSLSIGIEGGFLQKSIIGSKLRYIDPNDPFIPTTDESDGKFTGSFGLFYQNEGLNKLHVGLSSTNLVPQIYRYGLNSSVSTITSRHYYALAGMEFGNFMNNPLLTFHPSILLKYNAVLQADATALVEFMETMSGGVGYRSVTDAFSFLFGYKVKGIRIGASYDITLSRLNRVSAGTVELCLNYCWDVIPKEPTVIPIINPRVGDRESWTE